MHSRNTPNYSNHQSCHEVTDKSQFEITPSEIDIWISISEFHYQGLCLSIHMQTISALIDAAAIYDLLKPRPITWPLHPSTGNYTFFIRQPAEATLFLCHSFFKLQSCVLTKSANEYALLSYARFHAVISETGVDRHTFANSYQGNNPFQGTDVYSGPLDVQENSRNYFSKQISKKSKAKALH